MNPATRLSRPSRGIALLLAGIGLALLVGLGCRTMLSPTIAELAASIATPTLELDTDATAAVAVTSEHTPSHAHRQPLATPLDVVVATIVLAAAVATGLRYTITSVPDAGRATSGLRPPPLLRA